ncbi:SRPBCC family protein [Streptomyces sioyaensis]|uniref:SRPBCC family protein n=1 Tax=Streptomyces sioyaensis TaxID=67364 RepID=UPI00379E3D60
MIRLVEEAHRARWLGGATAPAVGARFRGYHRNGLRRWVTTCRITDADPSRCLAYEVTAPLGVPISRWQYEIASTAEGCIVTETNWMRAPLWFVPLAILVTGIFDRIGVNSTNISATLQRLKHHLESPLPSVADSSQCSDRPVG